MPLLHIVGFKFRDDLTDEAIATVLEKEVRAKDRMPDIIMSYTFGKNLTLAARADCNRGIQWVIAVTVADQVY